MNTKKGTSEDLKATLENDGVKITKIHPTAKVDPSVYIPKGCVIGPNVVIAKGAVLGRNVHI